MRGWNDVVVHIARNLEDGNSPIGVALVDIDHFGELIDALSCAGADEAVVRSVTHHLSRFLVPGDYTARIGEDDFLIIRCPLTRPAEIEGLGLLLVDSFHRSLEINDRDYSCSVSIGVATSRPGDDARSLLRYAQYALDDAKTLGRDRMVAFNDEDRNLLADVEEGEVGVPPAGLRASN